MVRNIVHMKIGATRRGGVVDLHSGAGGASVTRAASPKVACAGHVTIACVGTCSIPMECVDAAIMRAIVQRDLSIKCAARRVSGCAADVCFYAYVCGADCCVFLYGMAFGTFFKIDVM